MATLRGWMNVGAAGRSGLSTRSVRILSIGYTVLDAVWAGDGVNHRAGGTAANVAANLAWLGVDSALSARIGRDVAGETLVADLLAARVDVSAITADPTVRTPVLVHDARGPRPRYLFTCPRCGHAAASYRPPLADSRDLGNPVPAAVFLDRPSVFALDAARRAASSGSRVMFEPNGVGRRQLTEAAIEIADIVKISDDRPDELKVLLDAAPKGQLQIRTVGDQGLLWRFADMSDWHHEPTRTVAAIDSAGAGDWATTGILAALAPLQSWSITAIRDALSFGQRLAAYSCQFAGARAMSYALTAADVVPQVPIAFRVPAVALPPDAGCSMCLESTVSDRTGVLATTST